MRNPLCGPNLADWRAPYFGLPLHSCHRDAQEKDDRDGANDPDIVDIVCHNGICTLSETQGSGRTR